MASGISGVYVKDLASVSSNDRSQGRSRMESTTVVPYSDKGRRGEEARKLLSEVLPKRWITRLLMFFAVCLFPSHFIERNFLGCEGHRGKN
jgi:hypothetical protein